MPRADSGYWDDARPLAEKFLRLFRPYDAVVCPSGSCVAMVTHHYDHFLDGKPGFEELKAKTYELTQFLVNVIKLDTLSSFAP